AFNDEQRSAGYGIVNLSTRWELGTSWALSAGISNVFDKRYQDHLDGINRVSAVDVPLGQRLFGHGRSLRLGATVDW
ncbi:MAG: TonB-dependent receptor, partial [Gammaproteobacteria bacterium]